MKTIKLDPALIDNIASMVRHNATKVEFIEVPMDSDFEIGDIVQTSQMSKKTQIYPKKIDYGYVEHHRARFKVSKIEIKEGKKYLYIDFIKPIEYLNK